MSDRVAVGCPKCRTLYALPREFLGRRATCKKCAEKFVATPAPRGDGDAPFAVASDAAMRVAAGASERPAFVPAGIGSRPAPTSNPLDDSVMDWLNAAPEDETPARPKVVTPADLCDPSQRSGVRGRPTGMVGI